MTKRIINMLLVCSALTMWWGCSSDSDGNPSETSHEKPNWQLNLSADDIAPDWSVTQAEDYELTMSLGIKLNQVLAIYASSDDQIAAFINGTCRCVTSPSIHPGTGATLVSAGLNIVGNAGENGVTFKYYCKRLNRIFTLTNWMDFNPNRNPSQDGSAYVMPFERQTGLTYTQITIQMPKDAYVDLSAGDEIALLSDGTTCRSNVAWIGDEQIVLNALAPQGSQLTIDWYCASRHVIYEANETVALTDSDNKTVSVTSFHIR